MLKEFELSANGEKMLLALGHPRPDGGEMPPGGGQADVGDCAGECAGEGRRRRAVVWRCEDAG